MMLKKRNRVYIGILIFFIIVFGTVVAYNRLNHKAMLTIGPFINHIENNIILYKTKDLNEIETEDFIFRYEDIESKTLDMIKSTTEEKYMILKTLFQYDIEEKILVVIYNDTDFMMNNTMIRKGNPPMGVYYGESIHILNPYLWVRDIDNLEYEFYKEGPVLHELVHIFVDKLANGNFPIWFTEGVSLYFEYEVDGYEWGKEVSFVEKDYSIEELNSSFNRLNQYEVYTKSFRLVKGLVDNYGINQLMEIIQALGEGQNIDNFVHLF